MHWSSRPSTRHFNPPTPCGVGHELHSGRRKNIVISIHPPRVGWDPGRPDQTLKVTYFNPPTPCGVGRGGLPPVRCGARFQSTHPMWGGTTGAPESSGARSISIHPPHVGWDESSPALPTSYSDFNPPTPCGVGLNNVFGDISGTDFNPPTPCGVGPARILILGGGSNISIHPPHVGWDDTSDCTCIYYKISIHLVLCQDLAQVKMRNLSPF